MFVLSDIRLELPHKICFQDFSTLVNDGSRIGIIGRNGCGKSSLLKMIHEKLGDSLSFLVPQLIYDYQNLSGGEKFNKKLSEAISKQPDVLMLDEPTNHLDSHNRANLIRMLKRYHGIVLVATHDRELLRSVVNVIWHINDKKVSVFSGNYDDFLQENEKKGIALRKQLSIVKQAQKIAQQKVQKEQERQAHSKAAGIAKIRNKKWMRSVGHDKAMSAEKANGKVVKNLNKQRSTILEELNDIFIPEIIVPTFDFPRSKDHASLTIVDGSIGYSPNQFVLRNININLDKNLAILGPNASGKTTLVKAILNDSTVYRTGQWYVPNKIAYLDQHYSTLNSDMTPIETIATITNLSHSEIRKYLNNFLFRKNEEINLPNKYLSGGEKARLCLAQITILAPALLILDEVTNNIDFETKEHIVNILKNYSGPFIVVSHDYEFLKDINIQQVYRIPEKTN